MWCEEVVCVIEREGEVAHFSFEPALGVSFIAKVCIKHFFMDERHNTILAHVSSLGTGWRRLGKVHANAGEEG